MKSSRPTPRYSRPSYALFLGLLALIPQAFCAPLHPTMDPKNFKPPQFAKAENHLQQRFLTASRDWERMDVYVPKGGGDDNAQPKAYPCVLLIYGGGWRGKVPFSKENIQILLDNGYVVAVPDYVLTAQQPVPMAVWDGAAAIRYLRAHAEKYRIDPERIGAMGLSAGGWLLQHLAVADSRTVVSIAQKDQASSPVPTLEPHPANASFSAKLSAFVVDWGANQLPSLKPGHLTPDDPPMFTVHYDPEGKWPPGAQAYADAGAIVELAFVDIVDTHAVVGVHPRVPTPSRDKSGNVLPLGQRTLDFLNRYVKNPTFTTAPEILPQGGPIAEPTPITLRSVHPSAKIHYTLDGTPPTASSPICTQPLQIAPGTTLKALTIKPGLQPSSIATATFTACKSPWPVIITPEASFEGKIGQSFSTTFTATSAKSVTWHMYGKVSPVSDSGAPQAPMPALEIDTTTGTITGTSPGPGTAVVIITAGFQDGDAYLYDARAVTVTFR